MEERNVLKRYVSSLRNSVSFKIAVVFILVLLLLIPASMIESMIHEREYRKQEVMADITSKWGREQTLIGPVITIPYKAYFQDKSGERRFSLRYMHFLPDELEIKGKIHPEIRYRGIYEAVVYNADVELTGSFSHPRVEETNVPEADVVWSGAFVSVGLSDMRGIKEQVDARFDDVPLSVNPGLETSDIIDSGVSAKVRLGQKDGKSAFYFSFNLNGSQQLHFVPVGKETRVELASNWPDPSFDGEFLPAERSISKQGFQAKWKVLHLNRNYPQQWLGSRHRVDDSAFGVRLFVPVDIYQKSTRTAKYALMFIVFTFMAFFFSEVMNRLRIHPIQYLLTGFAVIIFYTLLLSISEHLDFDRAYLISCAAVIAMLTLYSGSVLRSVRLALMVGGILTMLYLYMYMVLQLEDYALLMGSIGLFLVLGVVMFATRKIDWYAVRLEDDGENA